MLPSSPSDPVPAGLDPNATAVRHVSPLARNALFVYAALLVYGSLTPWQGWRSLGLHPFGFLGAPWPAYVTGFDLTLNVLAYLPLGLLVAITAYPRLRGLLAVLAAVALGALISILLESAQTFLPTRIASNVDVITNVAGAALGAILGTVLAPGLVGRGRLQQARQRWFRADAGPLLLVLVLWPLAQIHPGPMLFGNGELHPSLVTALLALLGRQPSTFDAGQFAAAEVLVTASGMLTAGAALTATLRRRAPRLRLLLLLLAAALATKALTYGHEFGPARAVAWLTPGAISGLAIGLLAITAAANSATPRTASLLSLAALIVLVVVVNAVPPNPYHAHWLSAWQPGRMRDVAAATDWLGRLWPYALLAVLLWSMRREHHRPHAAEG